MKKTLLSTATFALCLAAAGAAHAGGRARVHEGFYLQGQVGYGYQSTTYDVLGSDVDINGFGPNFGLNIGGSAYPGVNIFGGWHYSMALEPSVSVDGTEFGEAEDAAMNLHVVGAGIDYYPMRRQGFHLQGMVGFALLDIDSGNPADDGFNPQGVGFSFGIGNDWWVADQFSVGILGRLMIAPVSDEGVDFLAISPSLACSLTFN